MVDRALWTAQELIAATGGTLHGTITKPINGVAIDSRNLNSGEVFIAIKGDVHDGHQFVVNALNSGAAVAVVSKPTDAMKAAGPILVVADDPLRGLENMGRAARAWNKGKVIAVTGSVGKTSTKEMLHVALSASGSTHASVASFNNHWGVPLTLSRMGRDVAFGVFEIGMNHAGEISPLVKMVKPHIAIITTIAASHLGHFKSLHEIAEAKAEIFSGVTSEGAAVINRDSEFFDFLAHEATNAGIQNIVSFGKHEKADVRLKQVALHPTCCCISADVMGEAMAFKLGMPGAHMALNSLAVLGAVKLAGADLARAALALADVAPPKGRGVQEFLEIRNGNVLLLDESYNANPESMAAAFALLATAAQARKGRRIAVLGDMLELGKFGPDLHKGLLKSLEENKFDKVYAAGPLMQNLWNLLPSSQQGKWVLQSADLIPALLRHLNPGDSVVIKGSLGSKMGPVVEALRKQFQPAKKDD